MSPNEQHSLQTYVSDMLALERHILVPVSRQLEDHDTQLFPQVEQCVAKIKRMTERHIEALERHLELIGGHEASPVKSLVSSMAGLFATAIDKVRKTEVSKNLRDDYTALSLAAISYTMLNASALGLEDQATASLAQLHLNDIAPVIIEISQIMPAVVLQDLAATGVSVNQAVAAESGRKTGDAWTASAVVERAP